MTREEIEKGERKRAEENRKYNIEETFLMWWFVLLFVILEALGLVMLKCGCSSGALFMYAFGISVVIGMVVGLLNSQDAESWNRKLESFLSGGFLGWFIGVHIVFYLGCPVFLVAALNLGLLQ